MPRMHYEEHSSFSFFILFSFFQLKMENLGAFLGGDGPPKPEYNPRHRIKVDDRHAYCPTQ
jgi:hypothetical protein